jgi:hypothetical protein
MVTVVDGPRYGYGKGQRPLWTPRDRDAEVIRRVLRRGGFHDVDERHLDGFAVEGGSDRQPFSVAYCGDVAGTVGRYQAALERAGLRVRPDPDPAFEDMLLVDPQSIRMVRPVPRPARAILTAAVVCAVAATVALIGSWAGAGQVRLAGGIGSAVFGATAAFLAGLWHERRVKEQSSGSA